MRNHTCADCKRILALIREHKGIASLNASMAREDADRTTGELRRAWILTADKWQARRAALEALEIALKYDP